MGSTWLEVLWEQADKPLPETVVLYVVLLHCWSALLENLCQIPSVPMFLRKYSVGWNFSLPVNVKWQISSCCFFHPLPSKKFSTLHFDYFPLKYLAYGFNSFVRGNKRTNKDWFPMDVCSLFLSPSAVTRTFLPAPMGSLHCFLKSHSTVPTVNSTCNSPLSFWVPPHQTPWLFPPCCIGRLSHMFQLFWGYIYAYWPIWVAKRNIKETI